MITSRRRGTVWVHQYVTIILLLRCLGLKSNQPTISSVNGFSVFCIIPRPCRPDRINTIGGQEERVSEYIHELNLITITTDNSPRWPCPIKVPQFLFLSIHC